MKTARSYSLFTALLLLLACFLLPQKNTHADNSSSKLEDADASPRRLEVLFLGSRDGSHKPKHQFRTIRRALGPRGVNFTYTQDLNDITPNFLAQFDALLLYGNHDKIAPAQEQAILNYSHNGGGCVFLHSACGCFRNSDKFIELLGAQFASHGKGVFTPKITDRNHPITEKLNEYTVWDETYVHKRINPDKRVLMKREQEPWTWVRTNGKGRVFYTASGHDDRCWTHPDYQQLVFNGIKWAVGETLSKQFEQLQLPLLQYTTPPVNIIQGKQWKDEPQDRGIPNNQLQLPLSPSESLKLAQVPVDMKLELFASEPMVINPIAINWDRTGRLWVVEAYDYPNSFVMNSPGLDTIKILEDTNGDGKADTSKTFASGLTIATSVLPIDNGCITTDGKNMVYLEDTNNDGKADKRHIIWSGINLYDTHACVSNIRLGFDGWIYATVGYSGVKTQVAGKSHHLKQGLFRFKRDGSAFESLQGTTNNTWGLSFNEQGRPTGSTANMNPSWYLGIPNRFYQSSSIKPQKTPRADHKNKIYPITFDYLQVDWKDHFTAAAGHTIYTARLFDKTWWNQRALVCAPTGKLVSAARHTPTGSGFSFSHSEYNIYASADAWSAPVAAEVGPDGAIYIADWYNAIVQHNVYGDDQEKGKGNAYITNFRDRKHGRIYRITPKNAQPHASPTLDSLENAITALDHSNMFWRQQAQEFLLNHGSKAIPHLKKIAQTNSPGSLHAIHTLGQLDTPLDFILENDVLPNSHLAAVLKYLPPSSSKSVQLLKSIESRSPSDALATLLYSSTVPKTPETQSQLRKSQSILQNQIAKDPLLKRALMLAREHHGLSEAITTVAIPRVPLSLSAKRGEKTYKATCIACHQPDGEGTPSVFPPLDTSDWLSRDPEHAIMVMLHGLSGPITVNGKKYNGVMPAHNSLNDQEIADVLNYTRNAFSLQLGDIPTKLVTQTRSKYADHSGAITTQSLENIHSQPILTKNNITLTGGKSSAQANTNNYLNLPKYSASKAAKLGVKGNLTIDTHFTLNKNHQWAQVWSFGSTRGGEGVSDSGLDYIALIPKANSGKLRLTARHKGKEVFIDWKPLELNKAYHVRAQYTPNAFHLIVNGKKVGSQVMPNKLQLESLPDFNCWLGRSLFNDPLFAGKIHSFSLYDF
ncbi:PVC-type heme-binding CxxCH protein [Rubritalea tangerina]|uniref:PVC-type heme-binding CxxCH protein n=2 Tax=Rubritalea tangerina TaxID=430798 RepID=A0ABW4Z818_9BACT